MPSRSIIRTGVGPHREPGNRFPAMAAINLLAARAARVQSRRNLSRSLSPKLDHSHSITRFDRSRTGPKGNRTWQNCPIFGSWHGGPGRGARHRAHVPTYTGLSQKGLDTVGEWVRPPAPRSVTSALVPAAGVQATRQDGRY